MLKLHLLRQLILHELIVAEYGLLLTLVEVDSVCTAIEFVLLGCLLLLE